jgi:glutaredoxin
LKSLKVTSIEPYILVKKSQRKHRNKSSTKEKEIQLEEIKIIKNETEEIKESGSTENPKLFSRTQESIYRQFNLVTAFPDYE